MSFGYTDDWVDPPEPEPTCGDCGSFVECGCGRGWCPLIGEHVDEDDTCRLEDE